MKRLAVIAAFLVLVGTTAQAVTGRGLYELRFMFENDFIKKMPTFSTGVVISEDGYSGGLRATYGLTDNCYARTDVMGIDLDIAENPGVGLRVGLGYKLPVMLKLDKLDFGLSVQYAKPFIEDFTVNQFGGGLTATYALDTWSLKHKLTLQLGLGFRYTAWEMDAGPVTVDDTEFDFVITGGAAIPIIGKWKLFADAESSDATLLRLGTRMKF